MPAVSSFQEVVCMMGPDRAGGAIGSDELTTRRGRVPGKRSRWDSTEDGGHDKRDRKTTEVSWHLQTLLFCFVLNIKAYIYSETEFVYLYFTSGQEWL